MFVYISRQKETMFIVFWLYSPQGGQGHLIHEVSRPHTTKHHSRQDSSGRVISSSQKPLPDNTQHSQQTYIHASGAIRTHNHSQRAATDIDRVATGNGQKETVREAIYMKCITRSRTAIVAVDKL